jgi:hypothetical protein
MRSATGITKSNSLSPSFTYHIKKNGNLVFVCLTDITFKLKVASMFLDEIVKKFKEKYSAEEIASAFAYGMNSSFSEIYKQQIVAFC